MYCTLSIYVIGLIPNKQMKDVEEMKSTTFSGLHVSKRHQNTVGNITPEDTVVEIL